MPREFVVHADPEKAYRKQVQELENIKRAYGADNYTKVVRELCQKDIWFLMMYAMNYKFMDATLHGRIFAEHYKRCITGNKGRGADILTLVPRGHCKTTFLSAFLVQEILCNPDIAIAIVSGTEKLAKFIAKQIADTLRHNTVLQAAFPDILPSSDLPASNWGIRGYYLPNRKARIDPTLVVGSVTSNVTGTHPDILVYDDIVYGSSDTELAEAEQAYIEAMGIMPPHGKVILNGTRWHDGDLYGRILDGKYSGNLGAYETLIKSCYRYDATTTDNTPIYPKKVRNGMTTETGFSVEDLQRRRKNNEQFFFCQFLNDPAPAEAQILKLTDVQLYKPEELPLYARCWAVGVEVTGPSVTFPELFRRVCEEYHVDIQIIEIQPSRDGKGKEQRILNKLVPIISNKNLYAQEWMIADVGGLGEEIRRFGKARHDDIVDALHMVPMYLSCGIQPEPGQPATLYIAADLAFTTTASSDFTVFVAVAIDSKGRHWIVDYKRFQERNPIVIAQELIKFYQAMNSKSGEPVYNRGRGNRFALSYK